MNIVLTSLIGCCNLTSLETCQVAGFQATETHEGDSSPITR